VTKRADAKKDATTIHVMAPMDDREADHMGDERLCEQPDNGETVIFHPNAEPCGSFWLCPDCGESSSGAGA